MLIARPVAGDIAQTRGKGAGDANGRDQEQKRLHQHGLEIFRHIAVHLGEGFGSGCAGIHLRLHFRHGAQAVVGHDQAAANNDDCGDPRQHINQVQLEQAGKAHAQHFPEQLHAGLGQILLGKVAFAALAVIEAVHHFSKHSRSLR